MFDAKIINNQEKHNRTQFVAPEARSKGALLVVMGLGAFFNQSVGKGAQIRKSIDSVVDFKRLYSSMKS